MCKRLKLSSFHLRTSPVLQREVRFKWRKKSTLCEAEWESGCSHCLQAANNFLVLFILLHLNIELAVHQSETSHVLIYGVSSRCVRWMLADFAGRGCRPVPKLCIVAWVFNSLGRTLPVLRVLAIWPQELPSFERDRVTDGFSVDEFTQPVWQYLFLLLLLEFVSGFVFKFWVTFVLVLCAPGGFYKWREWSSCRLKGSDRIWFGIW